MPLRACLFDLDGTLLDTLADLTASINFALASVGCPPRSPEEVRSFLGDGAEALMARSCGASATPAQATAALATYRVHYAKHAVGKTLPYPGIPELLAELRTRGIRLGVVSNKPQEPTSILIEHFFPGLFEVVYGARPDLPRKPAPDMLLAALRDLGVDACDAAYLGDGATDVLVARAAGVPGHAALWGFRSREVLESAGATSLVATPDEFLTALVIDETAPDARKTNS